MSDSFLTHPSDQTLRSFARGQLSPKAAERLPGHLATCLTCRARARDVSTVVSTGVRPESADRPDSASLAGSSLDLQPGNQASRSPERSITPDMLPPGLADHPDYRILRELGRGGMGVVYLAHNQLMGRDEVLKVMGRHIIEKPGVMDRFLREIRAVARLRHANIVTAYSAFRLPDSIVFAMEYVEGHDLSKLVKAKGPLSVAHATNFIYQAALGLQHAHEEGMVHRDIKPGNLMLSRKGGPRDHQGPRLRPRQGKPGAAARSRAHPGRPDAGHAGLYRPRANARRPERRYPGRYLQPGLHSLLPAQGRSPVHRLQPLRDPPIAPIEGGHAARSAAHRCARGAHGGRRQDDGQAAGPSVPDTSRGRQGPCAFFQRREDGSCLDDIEPAGLSTGPAARFACGPDRHRIARRPTSSDLRTCKLLPVPPMPAGSPQAPVNPGASGRSWRRAKWMWPAVAAGVFILAAVSTLGIRDLRTKGTGNSPEPNRKNSLASTKSVPAVSEGGKHGGYRVFHPLSQPRSRTNPSLPRRILNHRDSPRGSGVIEHEFKDSPAASTTVPACPNTGTRVARKNVVPPRPPIAGAERVVPDPARCLRPG